MWAGNRGDRDSGQRTAWKTVALRADMDALPYVIDGENVARHTCGHDSHSAMVMTAARMLAERGDSLRPAQDHFPARGGDAGRL